MRSYVIVLLVALASGCVAPDGPQVLQERDLEPDKMFGGASTEVHRAERRGSVDVANPVLRVACDFDLALCRAAAVKEGVDHHLLDFRGVPSNATMLNVTVRWTDSDPGLAAQIDLRIFDGAGKPMDFLYSFHDHAVDLDSQSKAEARREHYQLMVWVHQGGRAAFNATAVARVEPGE